MRGRGLGRGRGYGRGSFIQNAMRDSMEEGDIDLDNDEQPQLYPSITLPLPSLPDEHNLYCILKTNQINEWFQKSRYHLKRKNEEKDEIERYSDKLFKVNDEQALYEYVDISEKSQIPKEFLIDIKKSSTKIILEGQFKDPDLLKPKDGLDSLFQKFESYEKATSGEVTMRMRRQESQESKDKDTLSDSERVDEVEGMDDGDYVKDYYASDEGEEEDFDNEATFD